MAWIPAAIGAIGSIGGGLLSAYGGGQKESKMERTKRKLVDKLLASLESGQGPFADLFNVDEDAFYKSFVEPAQARFRNQIAPQIQQQFIASGQQRGTGLDDQLLRAGVDLDSMLNEHMMNFQQGALNRKQNMLGNILGQPSGSAPQPTFGQNFASSTAGYFASPAFQDLISGIGKPGATTAPQGPILRRGYAQ